MGVVMAVDDYSAPGKNFRSTYYESLGFRENEKSVSQLENCLRADVIDLPRLKDFCLRNGLPAIYRPLVWKLLLEVQPKHQKDVGTRDFIISQKTQQFDDLKRALAVCRTEGQSTTPLEDLVQMHFINRCIVTSKHETTQFNDAYLIAKPFLTWFKDEIDAFFSFSKFFDILENFKIYKPAMIDEFNYYLSQREFGLYSHLSSLKVLPQLPYKRWFDLCFVIEFPLTELELLWDRMIAGSCSILMYTSVALILHKRRYLMSCKDHHQVLKVLENITEDDSLLILKLGLDLWEANGSQCTPPISEY